MKNILLRSTSSSVLHVVPSCFHVSKHHFSAQKQQHDGEEEAEQQQQQQQQQSSSAIKPKSGYIVPGTINISSNIMELRQRKLHQHKNNPIGIIKHEIENHFASEYNGIFTNIDNLDEKVTTEQNFNDLLIPEDHPSRNLCDTYYFDDLHILRPQTSAHQTEILRSGEKAFLITGDCYRKDTIDKTHFPCFHQMEGVRIWKKEEITQDEVKIDLQNTLEKLVTFLFPNREFRWLDDYFPFTDPSFEMEVKMDDDWLEIFGSGVIHEKVLEKCNLSDHTGWAFGLGLERLAMPLFEVNDIRQFWSNDERFLNQFKDGKVKKFSKYSKFPVCYKDISFWLNDKNESASENFHENDLMDLIRNIGGDIVESVELVDKFEHPKTSRVSLCYRILYRHNDRTLTNEEVNELQQQVRDSVEQCFDVEIRG